MNKEFVKRIAVEQGIAEADVLFGVTMKRIVWDNCAGSYTTMSNVGQPVYLQRHADGVLSAYFDYGDTIISDMVDADQVKVVSEFEADAAALEYERARRQRVIAANRVAIAEEYDFDDEDDECHDYSSFDDVEEIDEDMEI